MIGSGNITDVDKIMQGNPTIKIIWAYRNSTWSAYSANENTLKLINNAGYNELYNIARGEGFWIYIP